MDKLHLPKTNKSQSLARWQIVKKVISDILFPVTCIGCGTDDEFICSVCLEKLGVRNFNESWEKLKHDEYLDRVFIASWYEQDLLKQMIQLGKYQGQTSFLQALGTILIKFWQSAELEDYFTSDLVIIPIPLHPRRLAERGYNQSEILAKVLADKLKLKINIHLINRKKYTKHQTKLTAEKRQANVQGVFKLNKIKIIPWSVLLIDDVTTTGASLNEVAKLLKNAGVNKVYALVVAKN